MTPESLWSKGSNFNAKKAKEMVEFIEQRSNYIDQKKVNLALKNMVRPKSGENLLDVGCGSGILTRLMAPYLTPEGSIIGVDTSPYIVELARGYANNCSSSSLINFEVGDATDLHYSDGIFDAAFAARLLLHVDNPQAVVGEMIRVVKSGGRIVLMDWDFETLVIDHPNRELTRRIFHWRTDNKDGNNWSGRQLYRLLKEQEIKEVVIEPINTISIDENNSLTHSIYHAASGALDEGVITPHEYTEWVTELKTRLHTGLFFASIVYFIAKGNKP
ncbi:MAG: methyltransferase domain-containing protein [Candidatus Thorarchaeota archaeon]